MSSFSFPAFLGIVLSIFGIDVAIFHASHMSEFFRVFSLVYCSWYLFCQCLYLVATIVSYLEYGISGWSLAKAYLGSVFCGKKVSFKNMDI